MQSIEITRPDDWHVHLRDDPVLRDTVKDISRYFGRAIVMPNLATPVTNVEMASQYRRRILAHLADDSAFEPMMTLYLTDRTTTETVKQAGQSGLIRAFKFYPAGAPIVRGDDVTKNPIADSRRGGRSRRGCI